MRAEELDLADASCLATPERDPEAAAAARLALAARDAVDLLLLARRNVRRPAPGARPGLPAEEILARLERRAVLALRHAVAVMVPSAERDRFERDLAARWARLVAVGAEKDASVTIL